MTSRSEAAFRPLIASWTTPVSEYASDPRGSLDAGIPKTSTAPTPAFSSSLAIPSYPESGYVITPGMESVVRGESMFASKNSGRTSSDGSSLVSATMSLIFRLDLSLLMRTCG